MYKVTRVFTSGLLKGATFTELSRVKMECKHYNNCIGGVDYVVVECLEVV